MKTTNYLFVALGAAALTLTACNNDDDVLMLAGAALTRALEAAHLGIVNRMLGAVTGMVLHLLFLGVLIKVVEYIDPDEKMLTPEVKEQSVFYHPVGETAGLFFPAIKQVTEQLIK